MKKMKTLLIAVTLIVTGSLYGQDFKVNVNKSSIKWTGKKVTGEHFGHISLKNGELTIKDNKIASGKFIIDMESITNDDIESSEYNQKLIDHLKSDDFFGVQKFPTATLSIIESKSFEDDEAEIKANLTIKGITNPVSFITKKNNNVYVASIVIDRSKYDIRYGSGSFFEGLGDKMISDEFVLDLELILE